MGVLHGNRDRVEPPGPNLVKSRDPLADPIGIGIILGCPVVDHLMILTQTGKNG